MKIKENKYTNLDQLHNDIDLLCKNTQEYNMEGSLVSFRKKKKDKNL